ncbi:MAG: purine-binding chemotaxis protein CheW [Nitrospirae bacterium]|nr:purine-binding chemotaxis protein CheW [Nitrospirota bacterium]
MNSSNPLVIFTLDDKRYALSLFAVERVLRIVEIVPLPKAPEIVLGVVNIQGQIVPVFDVRKRFCLPQREMSLSDQLIVARTSRRAVALLADTVGGVIEYPEQKTVPAEMILPGLDYVKGVAKLDDGLILIHDLETFLSLPEDNALENALKTDQR